MSMSIHFSASSKVISLCPAEEGTSQDVCKVEIEVEHRCDSNKHIIPYVSRCFGKKSLHILYCGVARNMNDESHIP